MQIIKINLNKITQEQIDLIVDYLKQGLVIAYPTDTVYGLGCDARNVEAIKRINKIKNQKIKKLKKQENKRPLLVLISDYKMLRQYCFINQEQEKYLASIWPGSVTVILKRRPNLPPELTGGLNSLAVRLPKSEFLIKIISKVGFPLVSTSLNKKADKPLSDVQNLEKYFKYLPDLTIDAGECKKTKPSSLVDIRDVENIKVLRK
ncbi:threonylcarbamoyl-AMP synthase [Patescibacteria group bacterium]|nr:threonylcarbamoyl-AMP synthase [Patescibacteria group bacterium]MBU1663476.1 threonylcarbamoyl-AMP synthase [Patescibacteria group bacterium]MBU1933721.1 threonylcarbamoyl-AMP synthase [Patescibacteria group bacterium]MBU2263934.1 threonylcarbamoyl-AMP synthase [Patescibacteria group bacterium]